MAENFQAEVCGGSWPWQWNGLFSSSPCFSTSINIDNLGGFGTCLNPDLLDNKLAWSSDEAGSPSDSSIVVHQDKHQIMPTQQPNSSFDHSSSQISTNDWINPTLFQGDGSCEAMNQGQETEEQKASNYLSNISQNSSHLSKNFSTYDYSSNLLQTLFETEPQTQEPFYDTNSYQATLNDFSSNSLINELSSSMEKQKPTNLSTKTNTCNSSHVALNDFPITPFPPGPPFFTAAAPRPSHPNFKAMIRNDEVQSMGTVTKKSSNCEPTFKRPRIETPTPLPTFKVRKEKMGDRITALQQLVSPFGKTDTASVLHEAIEYIKFLHDQVNALSTPYMKNGVTIQRQQDSDKMKEKGQKTDLKSRGLCLVPISSTFPVAAENTTDFWIPTFGGTFR